MWWRHLIHQELPISRNTTSPQSEWTRFLIGIEIYLVSTTLIWICILELFYILIILWTILMNLFQDLQVYLLKLDMPILTCIFFTFNWLTLTSEIHFMKFHPKEASCLLSRGKRKYAPLGMRLLWKYINYFLVHQLPQLHIFCHISKTTKNLKLKFWICD